MNRTCKYTPGDGIIVVAAGGLPYTNLAHSWIATQNCYYSFFTRHSKDTALSCTQTYLPWF